MTESALLRRLSAPATMFVLAASLANVATGEDVLYSTKACTRCHFPTAGEEGISQHPPGKRAAFCQQEEASIWERDDKHRQSLYLLLNDQNRELTNRILGFDVLDVIEMTPGIRKFRSGVSGQEVEFPTITGVRLKAEADAKKIEVINNCLACHSPLAEATPADPLTTSLEFGVSCQACHGNANKYYTPHEHPTQVWRVLDPAVKESQFGLRDLRNPAKRAELCASCHVGSLQETWGPGKGRRFVEHQWYANGHPPLPSLEFATFASQMPGHWDTIQSKAKQSPPFLFFEPPATPKERDDRQRLKTIFAGMFLAGSEKDLADTYLGANGSSYSATAPEELQGIQFYSRDVLISALTILGSYGQLVHDAAASDRLDFALYDCGACHHELRGVLPSASRVRRGVRAGRAPPAFWTLALSRLAANQAAEPAASSASLEEAIQNFDQAFSIRPLGDRKAMQEAGGKLSATCRHVAAELAKKPFTKASSLVLLDQLLDGNHDVDRDYHAARQSAWAIREVLRDLAGVPYRYRPVLEAPVPGAPQAVPIPPELARLLNVSEGRPGDDPAVRSAIDNLFGTGPWQGPLRLRLPSGQETVMENLRDSLAAIATYDPAGFRLRLEEIRKTLAAENK